MKIIILGATRGLGLELVRMHLQEGHMVAAGVIDRTSPPSLVELDRQYPGKLKVFQADVTNEEELLLGAHICTDFLGAADGLVNVAGVLLQGDRVNPLYQCDVKELRTTFEVNTIGAIIAVKCFYPVMNKDGEAKYITITSEGVGVKNPGDWVPCYALSKTAATKVAGIMNMMVKDVAFYSLHPGRMNTEMGRQTAQIEPRESAQGIYNILNGVTPVSVAEWYI
ncbi:MAG: SDR family NAD(P)-dependent oxidoreductase, partial [Acetanaerobacterium sp.]